MAESDRFLKLASKCKTIRQLSRVRKLLQARYRNCHILTDDFIRVDGWLFGYTMCMVDNCIGFKQ